MIYWNYRHMNKTPELCLEAVKQNSYALNFVPDNIKTSDFYLEVVKHNCDALIHVPENLKHLNYV